MRKRSGWPGNSALSALLACAYFAFSTASYADITYYHLDALGSPIGATDATGAVIWRVSYYPYGDKTVTPLTPGGITDAAENTRWYTAHVDDFDTGLTYMEARYYDPVIGRFMGVDPVGFSVDNPASFNRYSYASNNPYLYIDPNGEDVIVFNVSARLPKILGLAQYIFDRPVSVTGVEVGIAFSLADSNGNGMPELDAGLVGTLEMDSTGLGAGRFSAGVQRNLNNDPSVADLAGFGAYLEGNITGVGGRGSVGEDGTVMYGAHAGAVMPGVATGAEGTGVCTIRAGCKGWNSSRDEQRNESDDSSRGSGNRSSGGGADNPGAKTWDSVGWWYY